ncbi:MAG: TldD/PmbA family protein [Thaumarchaeota archaeon]|nr:MAG: TldD/PmbA family protein [Nitrososphaerota archaeon]
MDGNRIDEKGNFIALRSLEILRRMDPGKLTRFIISDALKLGATDVVAEIYIGRERRIKFANNEVVVSEERDERSAEIFVAIKEKRASVSTDDLSIQSIREAVRQAVSLAKMSEPAEIYAELPKGPFKYDKSLLRAGKVSGEPEKLIEHVEAAVNAALAEGAKRAAGTLIYSSGKTWLRTSGKAYGVASEATIEISVRALASEDATGHFVSIAADDKDFDPEEAGKRAGEIAKMALNPIEGEPGEYETLLGPMVFAHLAEHVGDASSAFYVDAGLSFLKDKLGQQVSSEIFSLIDDPTIPKTYGSAPFDDEGIPTRRNVIIDRGVLKTYLHNSTTAKKFGAETTANAGLIIPTPFNLIVEGGGKSFEKLLSSIDDGIYVTNDWYLRYQNYRTGDFSTIPRDGLFRIKRGSIESSIKGLRISDNMLRILKGIRELGRERYWISWWEVETPVYAPHAIIEKVNFTKSTI